MAKKQTIEQKRANKKYEGLNDFRIQLLDMSKDANRKIRLIEAALKNGDIKEDSTPALRNAMNFIKETGRNKFIETKALKNLTPQQAQDQMKAVEKFLNSKSSTVKGHKDTVNKRDLTMQKKGFTQDELKSLYSFFGSTIYKTLRSKDISSDQILEDIQELKANKVNILDIISKKEGIMSEKEKELVNRYSGLVHFKPEKVKNKKGKNTGTMKFGGDTLY